MTDSSASTDPRRIPAVPCVWSGCTDLNSPVASRLPLCRWHYQMVIDDWQAPQRRKAQAVNQSTAKINRGERLAEGDAVPGWLYYVQVGDLLKIGYAQNVRARLGAYPPNVVLLAVEPGTRKLEQERHQRFRAHLAEGREWYRPDEELTAWVEKIRAEHGDPSEHAFRPQKAGARREQTISVRSTRRRIVT